MHTGPAVEREGDWFGATVNLAARVAGAAGGDEVLVTGATYRHPGVLAKIATTVDHLSGGRLEFGIGSGWAEDEHTMLGIPFHTVAGRIRRMEEAIEVCKRLWAEERATFEGKYFQLEDAIHEPKPIQKPYPPIWIGSGGPATLRLTARHADVWNASGAAGGTVEAALDGSRRLDEACSAIGRDPGEIRRSVQVPAGSDPAELVDRLGRYHEAGFTELVVMLSGGSMPTAKDPAQLAALVAEKVLPELRALA